jgi:hypothetical protein
VWVVLLLSVLAEPPRFADAQSVSVNLSGQMLVLDAGSSRLVRLSADGVRTDSTGGFGSRQNAFRRPTDVDATHGLRVLVADPENSRLVWLDRHLLMEADIPTGPRRIHRVAVNRFGEVFGIDRDAGYLVKYRPDGVLDAAFPDIRIDPSIPADVAVFGDDVLLASGPVLRILNRFGARTGLRRFETDIRRLASGTDRLAVSTAAEVILLDDRYRETSRSGAGPGVRDIALPPNRLILLDANGIQLRTLD